MSKYHAILCCGTLAVDAIYPKQVKGLCNKGNFATVFLVDKPVIKLRQYSFARTNEASFTPRRRNQVNY